MSFRASATGAIVAAALAVATGFGMRSEPASSFRPLPLGIDIDIRPAPDASGEMIAQAQLKDTMTGNVFATPYARFKKGESGKIVQDIHGLPELRFQGWAQIEIIVAVAADGRVASYTTTTHVGYTLKDSITETQSATVHLPN